MRLIKKELLLQKINNYIYDSKYPRNLDYNYSYGSCLGMILVLQVITGILLAMFYIPDSELAFNSVERIMRDINFGWLLRYSHMNIASLFFILVYLHIARNIYRGIYETYKGYLIGIIILIIMILTAFLGYSLVFSNMSLWGITVITSLLSSIPYLGTEIVQLIWGSYSVSSNTLNRLYSLHYLLPFLLIALTLLHIMYLHVHGGSNPLFLKTNKGHENIEFNKNYSIKDLFSFLFLFLFLIILISFYPNSLGHTDNYIEANPLITPTHIVPEWYLLPYYAILRAIPNKEIGVIAMLLSLVGLSNLIERSHIQIRYFKPISKFFKLVFFTNFISLIWIGSSLVTDPYIFIGQLLTLFYFTYLFILPYLIHLIEYLFIFYKPLYLK